MTPTPRPPPRRRPRRRRPPRRRPRADRVERTGGDGCGDHGRTDDDHRGERDGPNTPAPQPLAERTKVTASIPFRGIEAYGTLLLADYFGEFEKENIEIEIVEQQTNNAVVLLQQGDIDFVPAAPSAGLYNAIAGGADINGVGGGIGFTQDNHQGYYVRKGVLAADGTFDPCSLKGKKVSTGSATGLGSPAVVELSALLADVQPDAEGRDHRAAGRRRPVRRDGGRRRRRGQPGRPVLEQAEAHGDLLVVPFTQPITGYWMGKIRTEQPEVAAAIVRALTRTTRTYLQGDYRADPEVRAAIIESMGITEAQLQGPASIVFDPDFEFPVEVVAPVEAVWLEAGGILTYADPLPVEDYFDDSVRQAVVG